MKHRRTRRQLLALAGLLAVAGPAPAQQQQQQQSPQNYRIAYIDPLSGPFANVGEIMLNNIQYAVDDINAHGGVAGGRRLELLKFDSKLSAQESQSALQAAIDQGARVVLTGGSGSSVVAALVGAVNKHNERNPGQAVLVLNHSSIDPDLTGRNCSFWHFQLEANSAMKMKAIASYIATQPAIKKIYLLNQDYAHGRQWARYGRALVGAARPDIAFVGEDFHAIGRVKDFAPYLAKIKAAQADSVITGNWGQDLALLLRAAGEAGYALRYFNHSAGAVPGAVLAVSQAKIGDLTWVAEWHPGQQGRPDADALFESFRSRTGSEFLAPRIELAPHFLAAAIQAAGSTDAAAVAHAMEGLQMDTVFGPVRMRAEDHQLLLPQVVNTIAPVDGDKVKTGWEGTGWGFRSDAVYSGAELAQPSDCRMAR